MKFDGIKNIFKKEGVSNISISNKESKVIEKHRLYGILSVVVFCVDFIFLFFLIKYLHISNNYIILLFSMIPLFLTMVSTYFVMRFFKLDHVNFMRTLFFSSVFVLPNIMITFMSPSQKLITSHQIEKGLIIFGSFFLSFILFRWVYSINKNKTFKIALIYTVTNLVLMILAGLFIGYIFSKLIFPKLFGI